MFLIHSMSFQNYGMMSYSPGRKGRIHLVQIRRNLLLYQISFYWNHCSFWWCLLFY